jgi:hypothetical protein
MQRRRVRLRATHHRDGVPGLCSSCLTLWLRVRQVFLLVPALDWPPYSVTFSKMQWYMLSPLRAPLRLYEVLRCFWDTVVHRAKKSSDHGSKNLHT